MRLRSTAPRASSQPDSWGSCGIPTNLLAASRTSRPRHPCDPMGQTVERSDTELQLPRRWPRSHQPHDPKRRAVDAVETSCPPRCLSSLVADSASPEASEFAERLECVRCRGQSANRRSPVTNSVSTGSTFRPARGFPGQVGRCWCRSRSGSRPLTACVALHRADGCSPPEQLNRE